jgi:hypothetical protein
MAEKSEQDKHDLRETYVQLARLAHDSFCDRRRHEWKMHFGLWSAVGAVVYFSKEHDIELFSGIKETRVIGALLFLSYALHYILVDRGHRIDKARKHYYMDLAEGLFPANPDAFNFPSLALSTLWAIPYLVFTGCLLYISGRLL